MFCWMKKSTLNASSYLKQKKLALHQKESIFFSIIEDMYNDRPNHLVHDEIYASFLAGKTIFSKISDKKLVYLLHYVIVVVSEYAHDQIVPEITKNEHFVSFFSIAHAANQTFFYKSSKINDYES